MNQFILVRLARTTSKGTWLYQLGPSVYKVEKWEINETYRTSNQYI